MSTNPKKAIKKFCSRVSSGGTPSRTRSDYFTTSNDGHLWVKSKELLDISISDTEEKISDEGINNSSAKYFPENAVLMAMYGANVGQLGWLRKPATVNQAICGMVVDEKIAHYRYVFYALLHTRKDLVVQARGAAQQNLSQDLIKDFQIPLPALPIQHRIADILSSYDDLIENNTRRIHILEQMAQLIYQEWFGKVDKESLPKGWSLKTFGEVTNNFDFKRIPVSGIEREKMQGEFPYYGASGIIDFVNEYIFDGRYLLIAEDGENLNSRKTPIAFFANGKFWVNNHAHIIQAKPPMTLEFLYLFFANQDISGFITGAAQPKLSQQNLNGIPVLIPEQDLMNKFNDFTQPAIQEIELLRLKNTNLRQTRDLLLPPLISGEIEIPEMQDN